MAEHEVEPLDYEGGFHFQFVSAQSAQPTVTPAPPPLVKASNFKPTPSKAITTVCIESEGSDDEGIAKNIIMKPEHVGNKVFPSKTLCKVKGPQLVSHKQDNMSDKAISSPPKLVKMNQSPQATISVRSDLTEGNKSHTVFTSFESSFKNYQNKWATAAVNTQVNDNKQSIAYQASGNSQIQASTHPSKSVSYKLPMQTTATKAKNNKISVVSTKKTNVVKKPATGSQTFQTKTSGSINISNAVGNQGTTPIYYNAPISQSHKIQIPVSRSNSSGSNMNTGNRPYTIASSSSIYNAPISQLHKIQIAASRASNSSGGNMEEAMHMGSTPFTGPICQPSSSSGTLTLQKNQVSSGGHQVISSGPVIVNNPGMISINSPIQHYVMPKQKLPHEISYPHVVYPGSDKSRPTIKVIKVPTSQTFTNQSFFSGTQNINVKQLNVVPEPTCYSEIKVKTEVVDMEQNTGHETTNSYNSGAPTAYPNLVPVFKPQINSGSQNLHISAQPQQNPSGLISLQPFSLDFQNLLQQNTMQLQSCMPQNGQNNQIFVSTPETQQVLNQQKGHTNQIFVTTPATKTDLNHQKGRNNQMFVTNSVTRTVLNQQKGQNNRFVTTPATQTVLNQAVARTPATLTSQPKGKFHQPNIIKKNQNYTYVELEKPFLNKITPQISTPKLKFVNMTDNPAKYNQRFPCFTHGDWNLSLLDEHFNFGFSEEDCKPKRCNNALATNVKRLALKLCRLNEQLDVLEKMQFCRKVKKTYFKKDVNYSEMIKFLSDEWFSDYGDGSETESALESDFQVPSSSSNQHVGCESDSDLLVTKKVVILNNGSEEQNESKISKKKRKRYSFMPPKGYGKKKSIYESAPKERPWDYRIYSKISAMKKLHNIRPCYVEIESNELVSRALIQYRKNRYSTIKLSASELQMIEQNEMYKEAIKRELKQGQMFMNWFNNKIITNLNKFKNSISSDKPLLIVKMDNKSMNELRHYKQFNIVFPVTKSLPQNLPRNKWFIQLVGLGHVKIVDSNVLSEYFKET